MQVVSDLHLEFYKNPLDIKLKISSPYLALLGDICVCGNNDIKNMERFLDYYAPKYKVIFWLPGNHEFYTAKSNPIDIDQIMSRMKELAKKYGNVVFLNNKHCDMEIDGIMHRIIGTTLWAGIPEEKFKYAIEYLNDYHHIYIDDEKENGLITYRAPRRIKPMDVNMMHAKASKYVYRHIRESNLPLIILTHHKPFLSEKKEYSSSSQSAIQKNPIGYETDQVSYLKDSEKAKIKIWCYGHTHKHFNDTVHGIRFLSNPKGYPNQQTKFENNLTINIK